MNGWKVRSIRMKFLLLVGGVALVVGFVSAAFELYMSGQLLRDQMVKRGRYIARNLAYNSKYGVLTEDKPLLTQLLEGALSAGTEKGMAGESSDVVGAMIRDAKGTILAQKGAAIRDLPATPAPGLEERDAVTADGDRIILFRAPVTTAGSSGDVAAELGLSTDTKAPAEEQKGGVEVAISRSVMAAQQQRTFVVTTIVALALFAVGSLGGWYLIGRWVGARARHGAWSRARWRKET